MIFGQNDLLSWLIHAAPERERTVKLLTRRVLAVNFAAILVGPRVFSLLCNADSCGYCQTSAHVRVFLWPDCFGVMFNFPL